MYDYNRIIIVTLLIAILTVSVYVTRKIVTVDT